MSDDEFSDDHVDFEDGGDGGFEDFESGTTLGEMWRNNPLVKIGVIAGGLITVIGAIVLFGGQEQRVPDSQLRPSKGGSEAPGSAELSKEMEEAIQEKNTERLEDAIRNRESAIPTPIGTSAERLRLPEEEQEGEDPLERWRRIQEERQRQTVKKTPELSVDPNAEAVDALANSMIAQMEGILETKKPIEPVFIGVTEQEWLDNLRDQEKKEQEELAAAAAGSDGEAVEIVNILIPAGEIAYAQLITEANSDIPGPILAQLASGPFAGAKLLGDFEVEDEYLVLSFDTIVIDGIAHSTDAVAVNPDTTMIGMATEVDQRYFSRVILPAAAAFVEGISEGIASTNETTVVASGGSTSSSEEELDTREEFFKGIEAAGEKITEILEDDADETEILVRVESGTPMGILFVDPVTDETS